MDHMASPQVTQLALSNSVWMQAIT